MSTAAQQLAALANGQLSTGPRSAEGKAASSRNSLKLGLNAQTPILPGEDPDQLAQLTGEYEHEYQPDGPTETALLHALVRADWLVRRYRRIEAEVINTRFAVMEPCDYALGKIFIDDAEGSNLLEKIYRRQQAAERQYHRALSGLRAAQSQRPELDPEPLTPKPVNTRPANPVRFHEPSRPPVYTGGPTPLATPRDNWDNPALRL